MGDGGARVVEAGARVVEGPPPQSCSLPLRRSTPVKGGAKGDKNKEKSELTRYNKFCGFSL